ncbi:hypothetical protein [Ahrensia sp. R2A130]|uniref:hypothetical protein n=1 Tax=Ahrensia sp. R2A130 TaxID=744979 RepID=UPI00058D66FA|nr:hypothetical protein [Ahrensia sp. R2A130]
MTDISEERAETVAKAIWEATTEGLPWNELSDVERQRYRDSARVVLMPVTSPTPQEEIAALREAPSCDCISYNMQEAGETGTPEVVLDPRLYLPNTTKTVCVDACIAGVIESLWKAGIETRSSCCGHVGRYPNGVHYQGPMVAIDAPEMVPAAATILRADGRDWRIFTDPKFSNPSPALADDRRRVREEERERCALIADERADGSEKRARKYRSGSDLWAECHAFANAHRSTAAAIRSLSDQEGE